MKQLNIHSLYILILVLLVVSSCREDTELAEVPTSVPQNNVTLMLHIPGQKVPTTYSMTAADENNVNEVTVLAYKNNAGTEVLVEKIVIPSNQITNLSGDAKIEAAIPTNNYNRIMIITNANAQVASLAIGSALTELMNLQYTSATGRWNVSAPTYIPMSGQILAQTTNDIAIKQGVAKVFKDVKLTRMLARIDMQNAASASFTLKNIYVYNMNRNGLIVAGPGYQSSPSQPTLPGSVLKINPNPMVYNFAALNQSNQMMREIYTFEAAPATAGSISTSPRIIIEGTYNGVDYFYPVDFTYDGSDGTTKGSYMPIVRNHKYIFTIAEVKDKGYTSTAAALASTTNFTNIVVKLLAVDDKFLDVFYNKDNLLAITKTEYIFEKSEYSTLTETNLLSILTDVPGGWTATYTESDGVTPATWLKIVPGSGDSGVKANTAINVTQTAAARTGYIIIKAGRLEARVKVTQQASAISLKRVLSVGTQEPTYGWLPSTANTGSNKMLTSPYNFGMADYSTIKIRGLEFVENRALIPNTQWNTISDYLQGTNGKPQVDICIIAQDAYITPSEATVYADFLNRGGVLLVFSEGNGGGASGTYLENGTVTNLLRAIWGDLSSTFGNSLALTGIGAGAVFGLTDVDDAILNGPFGDARLQQWGEDASWARAVKNIPLEDVVVYSSAYNLMRGSGNQHPRYEAGLITGFRHRTKNFVYFGDGGFISSTVNLGTGAPTNSTPLICPLYWTTGTYQPIAKPNYGMAPNPAGLPRHDVYNSVLFCNIMAWAYEQAEEHGINSGN